MYQQAHSESERSRTQDVQAAMAQLPAETQQQLGEIMDTNPSRLRDSIAHALPKEGWTAEEREALWTIGAARMKQAQEGIDLALGAPAVDVAPSSQTPSLGAPLREQPAGGQEQASEREADASDVDPFRE